MQKSKLLGFIAAMVIAQSACSNLKDTISDMQTREPVQLIDKGFEMILSYKEAGVAMKQTASFEPAVHQSVPPADTICMSYYVRQSFPTVQIAQYAYQEAVDSLPEKDIKHMRLAMNGTDVSYYIPQYEGSTKSVVRRVPTPVSISPTYQSSHPLMMKTIQTGPMKTTPMTTAMMTRRATTLSITNPRTVCA